MYVGVDMSSVERWEKLVVEHPSWLERIFTPAERAHCEKKGKRRAESYAGLWAAKEAAGKALQSGFSGANWQDAYMTWGSVGEPQLHLKGLFLERAHALGISEWSLSISHESTMAIAMVVMK